MGRGCYAALMRPNKVDTRLQLHVGGLPCGTCIRLSSVAGSMGLCNHFCDLDSRLSIFIIMEKSI